jgi:hypothetical protein
MYSLRFGALQNIIMQRCKQISEEKTVESDIMNVSYNKGYHAVIVSDSNN